MNQIFDRGKDLRAPMAIHGLLNALSLAIGTLVTSPAGARCA
jgi:hypothetical protein